MVAQALEVALNSHHRASTYRHPLFFLCRRKNPKFRRNPTPPLPRVTVWIPGTPLRNTEVALLNKQVTSLQRAVAPFKFSMSALICTKSLRIGTFLQERHVLPAACDISVVDFASVLLVKPDPEKWFQKYPRELTIWYQHPWDTSPKISPLTLTCPRSALTYNWYSKLTNVREGPARGSCCFDGIKARGWCGGNNLNPCFPDF